MDLRRQDNLRQPSNPAIPTTIGTHLSGTNVSHIVSWYNAIFCLLVSACDGISFPSSFDFYRSSYYNLFMFRQTDKYGSAHNQSEQQALRHISREEDYVQV